MKIAKIILGRCTENVVFDSLNGHDLRALPQPMGPNPLQRPPKPGQWIPEQSTSTTERTTTSSTTQRSSTASSTTSTPASLPSSSTQGTYNEVDASVDHRECKQDFLPHELCDKVSTWQIFVIKYDVPNF
jgi:hypothetical protein